MIRPAVESAIAVARAGLTADPVVQPPAALRPYLNFAKQTPRSLEAVARAVDRDADFREQVSAVVEEQQVGRPGWLWLTRPDGWEGELAALEAEASAREAAAVEEREERSASRKLAASQAAAVRAEAAAAARLHELDEARTDLARERAARAVAEARVAELEERLAEGADERAAVVRNLKDVEAKLVDRATEVNATKARVRALEAEARDRRASGGAEPAEAADPVPPAVTPERSAGRPATAAREPTTSSASDRTAPRVGPPGGPDPASVALEVSRAADGASALAEALATLARLLDGGAPAGGTGTVGPTVSGASPTPLVGAGEELRSRQRRVPVALPGGVFDDSVEAADHLLRTPSAVLVVDGYNVSMEGWPELGAAEQRRRLVACVSDLAHRTATAVELVFDGAEVEPLTMPSPARQMVRVRFSEPGVEADDVVIDLVGRIPATTPVIVASSDNRVRDGARRRGANLLHARQLLAVMRR